MREAVYDIESKAGVQRTVVLTAVLSGRAAGAAGNLRDAAVVSKRRAAGGKRKGERSDFDSDAGAL